MSSAKRPIKFGCSLGQEWVTWTELREAYQNIEEMGFDSLWSHDNMTPADAGKRNGSCMDGWTILSAMASLTQKIRVGCMVTSHTFRHPSVLAKMGTTVDIISGGRLILGIGAGWSLFDHIAYGIPFFTNRERLERLDEAVQVIRLLWESKSPVTFQGRHYILKEAPFDPKPVQKPRPPILVAGGGEKRTLRTVARWADAMNVYGSPEIVARKLEVLQVHCHEAGRNYDEIEKTVLARFVPPEQEEEWKRHLEDLRKNTPDLLSRGQGQGIVGDLAAMREWVQERADLGIDHVILTLRSPYPFDSLKLFAEEVVPHFK